MTEKNIEEASADDPESKPSRKWMVIVLAVVLSLGGLAGGLVASIGVEKALHLVTGGGDKEGTEEMAAGESSHAKAEGGQDGEGKMAEEGESVEKLLAVSPLKEIIVNIVAISETGRKSSRFLKVNLALVFDENVEGSKHVADRKVYIRDAFQNYLRQLTERDLSGSIGIVRLKSELLRRARAVAESDAPQEVLIADIIVQ